MVDFLIGWVTVSLLYLSSAIYCSVVYREELPESISLALFVFGSAIFLAVNRRYIVSYGEEFFELAVLALIFLAWVFAMMAIRTVVSDYRRWEANAA